MAKPADHPQQFVSRISLVGRSRGAVAKLPGFKKRHHTAPESVTAATSAFLGKLCAGDLAGEGEKHFQQAKRALGYKRTELALEVTSPVALLTAADFSLEVAYSLEPADPSWYVVTRTLQGLRGGALLGRPEFNELFASLFSSIVFGLTQGTRVEAVIDAVEARAGEGGLTVAYPSDCRRCVLKVEGVAAEVICDGATLEMIFPRPGAPRELVEAFATVRAAFGLTRDRVLAGLL